jgi:hypothetical protein
MVTVHPETILVESDGPLVVLLRDNLDGMWLALAVSREVGGDEYLCVPLSATRLAAFRRGEIDLRAVFVEPQVARSHARLFIAAEVSFNSEFELAALADVPPNWLPNNGFFLTTFFPSVEPEYQEVLERARAVNRPVVILKLKPPEAEVVPKIDVEKLSRILAIIQRGVKHANSLVSRTLSDVQRKIRAAAESYTLQVLAHQHGSFEVVLQTKAAGDLFGHAPQVEALAKLDEIARLVDDPARAIEVARANPGHFIAAFRDLLQFSSSTDTAISYSWAEPQGQIRGGAVIRPAAALALYKELILQKDLAEQERTLIGVFRSINVDTQSWRLRTAEGDDYPGEVAKDSGVTLSVLMVDGVTYSLHCLEVLRETQGTGKEDYYYYLLDRPTEVIGLPQGEQGE